MSFWKYLINGSSWVVASGIKLGFGTVTSANFKIEPLGMATSLTIPLWGALAVGGILSSMFVDLVHSLVLSHLPQDTKSANREAMLLSFGASAAGAVGIFYLLNPDTLPAYGVAQLAIVGVLAEAIGNILNEYEQGLYM